MIVPKEVFIDDYMGVTDLHGYQLEEEQLIYIKNKIENVLKQEKGHLQKEGYVYFLRDVNGLTKIGCTSNINNRKNSLKKEFGNLELLKLLKSENMVNLERYYHIIFRKNHIKGEWFNLDKKEIENLKLGIFEKENYNAKEIINNG